MSDDATATASHGPFPSFNEVKGRSPEEIWEALQLEIFAARANQASVKTALLVLDERLNGDLGGIELVPWLLLADASVRMGRAPTEKQPQTLEWAIRLFKADKNWFGEGIASRLYGQAWYSMGKRLPGLQATQKAISIFRERGESPAVVRQLVLALKSLGSNEANRRERGDPERSKPIVEALELFERFPRAFPSDTADGLLSRCDLHSEHLVVLWSPTGDNEQAEVALKSAILAAKQAQEKIGGAGQHVDIDNTLNWLRIVKCRPAKLGGLASKISPIPRGFQLYQAALTTVGLDPSYLPAQRTASAAASLLAYTFEEGNNSKSAEFFFLQAEAIARSAVEMDRRVLRCCEQWERASKQLADFYSKRAETPEPVKKRAKHQADKIAKLKEKRFPSGEDMTPEEIYKFFKEMELSDIQKLAKEAIEASDSAQNRQEAEQQIIKMAPFFLDCTFPRLSEEEKESLRQALDRAEERFGSLAGVLGLDGELDDDEGESESPQAEVTQDKTSETEANKS